MINRTKPISAPTKRQQLALRLMIGIGLFCMLFFMSRMLDRHIMSSPALYWLLIATFGFTCFKILYEWYHYFFITVPPAPPQERPYTVDIFTTFCAGEPYDMIVRTLTAIQAITYPHTTYLCDEADDACLRQVCAELGVHHVTRTDKKNAKAGNINNALQQSTGELCVVLDPDHIPFPNFLDPIISHFNNPEVGFVQIVQAYYNHDESLIAKGAAQQTYQFYGPMMMTMNRYGTVQAIGANCTFRRTALESIGGHAAGLAEDMHTAMQLHAQGWRSVYVPAVLARGLVPSTLSAYYKQQLKWARGVFELLVTSYPRLFLKFSWRQKLHYGIIPFYYLSGIVFLINFLVPVISLFSDVYPLKLDLAVFAVIGLPLVISTVLIRHYVQRWVMEDSERGFHVVGGLLLIGTWWVFNLGFLYTLIRKKVPYIPTPKDASDEKNLAINLPNIAVLAVSLVAIGYGLHHDWNPFTFVMAGIAGMNCLFMVFILVASQQFKFRAFEKRNQAVTILNHNLKTFKRKFWLIRRRIYGGVRSIGLLLVVLTVCLSLYFSKRDTNNIWDHTLESRNDILLTGLFAPAQADGLSSLHHVQLLQHSHGVHADLVAFHIPWGNRAACFLPTAVLDSVYRNDATPLITWEPWQALFDTSGGTPYREQQVFTNIVQGKFDAYIAQFALQVKALQRPVLLRFAPEADNPQYPWSATGGNTAETFIAAWIYLHTAFARLGVYNAVWVWSPWKADAVNTYFPGRDYVDWVSIPAAGTAGFDAGYAPFHALPLASSGIPVLLTGLDTPQLAGDWQAGIQAIKSDYPEIKGIVLQTGGNGATTTSPISNWVHNAQAQPAVLSTINGTPLAATNSANENTNPFAATRGVNYTKDQYWYKNVTPLTKGIVEHDLEAMQQAGINTIKLYGPNIYDRVLLDVAKQVGMQVQYSFWIPEQLNFVTDRSLLATLHDDILRFVRANKNNPNITAWNLGNPTLQKLSYRFYQPELYYQQQAYLGWLAILVKDVKIADPQRPVSIDVDVTKTLTEATNRLHSAAPGINAYGLVLADTLYRKDQLKDLHLPYFFSNVGPEAWLHLSNHSHGVFIEEWQDQQSATAVTFNGLKDGAGRNKPSLYKLSQLWHGSVQANHLPGIKVLCPAVTTEYGARLTYHALVYKNEAWYLASDAPEGLSFEWYLVQTDALGYATSMQPLGKGAAVTITMPADVQRYKVYLVAEKGPNIITALSTLNTPLEK